MFNLFCHKHPCRLKKILAILTLTATALTAVLLIASIWINFPETLGKAAITSFVLACLFFVSFIVASFYYHK